jgi:hypothetical protein
LGLIASVLAPVFQLRFNWRIQKINLNLEIIIETFMYIPGLMAATGGRLRLDAVDVVTDCVSVETVSRKGFSILDMAS